MSKLNSHFIKVHVVMNRPGNPVLDHYQNARHITGFGVPAEEYAKIGASCVISLLGEYTLYVTENMDEIYDLMKEVEVEA